MPADLRRLWAIRSDLSRRAWEPNLRSLGGKAGERSLATAGERVGRARRVRTDKTGWLLLGARAALAGCVLLTGMGAFSPPGAPRPHLFPWDKAEHFSAFFAMTVCALAALPRAPAWWLGVMLSLAGGLIEVVQGLPFVDRDSDWKDWAADTLAILAVLGVLAAGRLRRTLAERR
jgi:hypothetical protein